MTNCLKAKGFKEWHVFGNKPFDLLNLWFYFIPFQFALLWYIVLFALCGDGSEVLISSIGLRFYRSCNSYHPKKKGGEDLFFFFIPPLSFFFSLIRHLLVAWYYIQAIQVISLLLYAHVHRYVYTCKCIFTVFYFLIYMGIINSTHIISFIVLILTEQACDL